MRRHVDPTKQLDVRIAFPRKVEVAYSEMVLGLARTILIAHSADLERDSVFSDDSVVLLGDVLRSTITTLADDAG